MKIYMASDHAGFFLKEKMKENLISRGFLVEDFGAKNFDDADDYPDFVHPAVVKFIKETNGDNSRGICLVYGASGTGEAIMANRTRGARAVVCNSDNLEIIKLGRQHNNANVLSIGAKFVTELVALEAVKVFMTTGFEGGRHAKRVLKIDMLQ